jgi:hypothetical protein
MTTNFQNWFIYDGEQVQGPFAAESLLDASRSISTEKLLVVSRVGLDRWYPISQLEHLLGKTAAATPPRRLSYQEELKATVEKKLAEISRVGAPAPAPRPQSRSSFDPFAQTSVIAPKVESGRISASIEQDLMRQTFAVAESIPSGEPLTVPETTAALAPIAQSRPAPAPRIATPGTLSYSPAFNYVVLRGRLRLGELRSPFVSAMIFGLFTFGIYWIYWYRACVRELSWHMYNDFKIKGYPPSIFSLIPVAHMMMIYYLAELMRNAESQNQYRRTSPLLASVLALFPPFAILYLQSALNHHWRLHVQHQK